MTISPTLGISNQYDSRPVMEYASIASQSLQQLGAQLQNDITTIQTNQQLRGLASDLQGVDPTDTSSPKFAVQMTNAITNNPLAAHSPVGIQAINQLGAAHTAAIQSTMLQQKGENQAIVAGIGAGAKTQSAQTSADARKYSSDNHTQLGEDALTSKEGIAGNAEAGKNSRQQMGIDGKIQLQQNKLYQDKNGNLKDSDGNIVGDYNTGNPPPDLISNHRADQLELSKADQANTIAEDIYNANPHDVSAQANYQASQKRLTYARSQAADSDAKLKGYNAQGRAQAPSKSPLSQAVPTLIPGKDVPGPNSDLPQGPAQAPASGSPLIPSQKETPQQIKERIKSAGGTKADLIKALGDAGYPV